MFRVFIIADRSEQVRELNSGLAERGFLCSIVSGDDELLEEVSTLAADLLVVAVDGSPPGSGMRLLPRRIKQETHLPVITLLSSDSLDVLDCDPSIDDFVVKPWDVNELVIRARRILQRKKTSDAKDLINCGDITIDLAKCEVAVGGRLVELTFKEYELLRFLATNKGKVFTREALLNKVWSYDYYGGDRTVDVHIRRLRSKLEDSACIETVRNIGYRFSDYL